MVRLWHIAAWPLVVKVPVLVAGLMVTVAVTTSQVVLWRFAQDQKSNLGLLTGAYLDGLSAAEQPAMVHRDARELFDALDRAQGDRSAGVEPPAERYRGLAEANIAVSLRIRREILLTLVLMNGCLTLAFALGGYFVLKRMLREGMAN